MPAELTFSDLADADLVAAARAGELPAFEELVARYERQVYALARGMLQSHHDAEDVLQVAFVTAVRKLDTLSDPVRFGGWVTRIAVNEALKILRRRRGQRTASLSEDGDDTMIAHPDYIADWRQLPEDLLARSEIRELLAAGLAQLSDTLRTVFLLRDIEGASVAETAELLGISPANVKVRTLRARLALREYLTRELADDTRARVYRPTGDDAPDHTLVAELLASYSERPGGRRGL